MRPVARAAGEDGEARSVDGMAKAMGGAQVKKNMVLVVGATGTLGRQVGPCAFSAELEAGEWRRSAQPHCGGTGAKPVQCMWPCRGLTT